MSTPAAPLPKVSRRAALIGAAVCPLAAACGSGDTKPPIAAPAAGEVLAATTEIPAGTGKIVGNALITQPEPGVFKAFVPRCTHAGCRLTVASGNKVDCPCHGSMFDLDGAVTRGPASQPLTPIAVTVQGNSILAG